MKNDNTNIIDIKTNKPLESSINKEKSNENAIQNDTIKSINEASINKNFNVKDNSKSANRQGKNKSKFKGKNTTINKDDNSNSNSNTKLNKFEKETSSNIVSSETNNSNKNDKKNFYFSYDAYEQRLKKIDSKIEKLDTANLDADLINDIIKSIDHELSEANIKMNSSECNKEDAKKIKEYYDKFINLNNKFLRKIMLNNPFENFIYSEDEDKDEILKNFFLNINKDIHWLDLDEIDFTTSPEKIVDEKNTIISNELIKILESNLNIKFSKIQKDSLRNDFTNIASSLTDDYEEIMEECNKIKTVTSTKLVSRPSYKNFISKSELKNLDPSKKMSTIRFNFLNYINLTDKQKRKEIANNLSIHMKSIKENLEEECVELKKKVKMFYILMVLALLAGVASPNAGILCLITIGSAAAFTQAKLISRNDRIKKLNLELESISKDTSSFIDDTFEKMEETTKELLEDENYKNVSELYKKKKKSRLNKNQISSIIEEQIRRDIINNLNALNDEKKDKIIEKAAQNKLDINSKSNKNSISTINAKKDNVAEVDVEIDL